METLTDEEQLELIGIMRRDNEYTTKLLNTNSQRMMTHLGKRMGLLRPVGRLHWWERGLDDDQRSAVMRVKEASRTSRSFCRPISERRGLRLLTRALQRR